MKKVIKKRKKRKNKTNFKIHRFEKDTLDEDHCDKPLVTTKLIDVVEKRKPIIVKMPVLLAKLNIDVDIDQTINLFTQIENVSNVEISIKSLDTQVVPPSTTVFLKGVLMADIEFINKGFNNTIHTLKVPIPWSKVTNLTWISQPNLSYNSQKEFMFRSNNEHEPSSQFEFSQTFCESIKSNLGQVHSIFHHELDSFTENKKLQINGNVNFCIELTQEQFINLNAFHK